MRPWGSGRSVGGIALSGVQSLPKPTSASQEQQKVGEIMKVVFVVGLSVVLAGICYGESRAQEKPADTKAIEAELDRFREGLFHAFNEGDYKAMLEKYCHKDVIATWQDGTTSKGHDEVLAEFAKLKQFIGKMTANPTTDKRLILNDGNLVIASGPMVDVYELKKHGVTVELHSRWEATLIRDGDHFVLVGFSASTDAFDNQVVDLYQKQTRYTSWAVGGGVGLLVGIVVALVVAGWLRSRHRAA
jgi:ketosteroid isomerase-like protein